MTPAEEAIFRTPWGWMGLRASSTGITRIVLPRPSRRDVERSLVHSNGVSPTVTPRTARDAAHWLEEAQAQLVEYLRGARHELTVPVHPTGSPFQRRVWRTIGRIPYGRVRSYRWVATRVGGPEYARAVGLALGANPVPVVVPCHRVVASDGSLGGFTGGLKVKRKLLALEGTLSQLQ